MKLASFLESWWAMILDAWPLKHLGVSTLHVEIEEDCVGLIKIIGIHKNAIPIFQIDHVHTPFGGFECSWKDINNYLETIKFWFSKQWKQIRHT
jgi:hypothetical protein